MTWSAIFQAALLVLLPVPAMQSAAIAQPAPEVTSDEDRAYAIAREAYDYYFPLLLMDMTRRAQTTVGKNGERPQVPVNGFWHWDKYPDASYRQIVRPNFDTLYSMSWLDLSDGPVVVSIPPKMNRYYLLPLIDMWTNVFAVLGTRTLGDTGGKFAIIGPGWHGDAPSGVKILRAPTDQVWMIGRIQTNGPSDYANVHRLQRRLTLTPAGQPKPAEVEPEFDRETPPLEQLVRLTSGQFFARAALLSGQNPPQIIDQPILARLARIGFRPGEAYDLEQQPPAIRQAVRHGVADALTDLRNGVGDPARLVGGWLYDPANISAYGGDYHQRAMVAYNGLGANRPEDSIYPSTYTDKAGRKLDGSKQYVLHFDKGKLPPSEAFWSLTAYDDQGYPIQAPQKRYAVGDRDPLTYNQDGSLDLYIGSKLPVKGREANWLPTLDAPFNLVLRIYSPGALYRAGRWHVPPIAEIE